MLDWAQSVGVCCRATDRIVATLRANLQICGSKVHYGIYGWILWLILKCDEWLVLCVLIGLCYARNFWDFKNFMI